MSRIGKMPIAVPEGVEVKIDGSTVNVKGKNGELTRTFQPCIEIVQEEAEIKCTPKDEEPNTNAYWGLTRTLLSNMVEGVSKGFEKKLELVGVGYRAAMKGTDLEISVGYSHPVIVKAPQGITFEVPEIRKWRKPEPYKGKGIRYEGEYVRRKAGKAGKE